MITEGEAQGDCRCTLKVSKQLETCLSAVTGLDICRFLCMKYQ